MPGPAQDTSSLAIGEKEETWDERRCGRAKADGTRCKAFKVGGKDACAGHLGLGIGKDPAGYAKEASRASVQARSERVEERKRRLRDQLASAVEGRLAPKILAAFEAGLDDPDTSVRVRSAEQLLSRVYGKPKETIETVTEAPAELKAVREMSREEREELWRRLHAAEEGIATA